MIANLDNKITKMTITLLSGRKKELNAMSVNRKWFLNYFKKNPNTILVAETTNLQGEEEAIELLHYDFMNEGNFLEVISLVAGGSVTTMKFISTTF